MQVLNAAALEQAGKKHPQARAWLESWRLIVQDGRWNNIVELRRVFPSADPIPLGKRKSRLVVTCFNVGGNDFRLLTLISYSRQIIQVEAVLTHAEYSKGSWKNRYQ